MKLQVPFVQLPVRFDADALAREIAALGESPWREHPQKFPGNFALPLVSVDGDPDSDAIAGPMRPTPWLARCPSLMHAMAALGAVWGRSRLMKLSGQAEVSPHADISYYWRERVRVHVPVLTQPGVRFICGDSEVHMAAGECWIFDTWRQHRVINAADAERIHLVADTVGSPAFWALVNAGRAPGHNDPPGWTPRLVAPDPDEPPQLRYETSNVPDVMTPWELDQHCRFLFGDVAPHPQLAATQRRTMQLQTEWQALWAEHGTDRAGWPRYRAALDAYDADIEVLGAQLQLVNGNAFVKALRAMVLSVALADRGGGLMAYEPRKAVAG